MVRTLVCMVALSALGIQLAEAQRRPAPRPPPRQVAAAPAAEFGVRGGYDFANDVGSAGAHLRIPLAQPLQLVPNADVYFSDAPTQWQINGDVVLRPRQLGGIYAGAGVAFVNRDFDMEGERATRTGYNLVAGLRGVRIADTNLRPLVEARWTRVGEYDPFRLVAGVDVPISGR